MDYGSVVTLVDADAALQRELEQQTVAQVVAAYRGMDWYDHDQIADVSARAGSVVRASAQTAATFSDAYLLRVLRDMLGPGARTSGTLRVDAPLRIGVPTWGSIYGRVADTVRFEVSKGKTLDDAVQIGLDRADAMVRTDLGLARRTQYQRSLESNPRVIGYRRVIHPELSKTGTCGLCIAAADRTYRKSELLPLHDRCKCTVLPVTSADDPGQRLNASDISYAEAIAAAGGNTARELKEVRVRYDWHGELGPTLTDASHRSADPGRLRQLREERGRAQAKRPDTREASQAFFATARRNL